MSTLGLDYGKVRIGVAFAEGPLAEPLMVITRPTGKADLFQELATVVKKYQVETIVIGLSEGKMASETRKFASLIKSHFQIPVHLVDETLTSKEARGKINQTHKSRRRHTPIDAAAAAIILQSWLDKKND